ncbi:hypothetical protein B0H10DRAFT_1783655 [Mycena sp. CBHHK59/15]|nr:hypothetical protein B0H10DRAFT_1783655 [Mycena sp. CBHHK59/15]
MSSSGHTAHSERPERSRNAKAQARHRAKRKAYIEQLEQTVTKLQTALGFSPDQVAALPPPQAKILELEQENARLLKENDELHRMLTDSGRAPPLGVGRRNSLTSFNDARACDRDYKRRKMDSLDDVYIQSPPGSSHNHDPLSRPPPLTIPQTTLPHHYSVSAHPSNHTNSSHAGSSSMFGLNGQPAFQIPNTPSGSSSTSSPPFSASPAQMHPSNSPATHRPPLPSHPHLSSYSQANQYVSVKAEDDNYSVSRPAQHSSNHHQSSHPQSSHSSHSQQHYSLPPFSHTMPDHAMDNWHGYSSERAPLHR